MPQYSSNPEKLLIRGYLLREFYSDSFYSGLFFCGCFFVSWDPGGCNGHSAGCYSEVVVYRHFEYIYDI